LVTGTPFILDVDTGVDDALALGLAHARPDINLLAVTTLAGNIDVINTTENTRRVLAYIDAGDVPIYQGASRPLARAHRDAAHYHGLNGLGNAEFPPTDIPLGPLRGPAAIIHLARQYPGEIVLVAVGPLTNIAIALNVFPELPSLLKRFVVMGGAYDVPGNVTPFAEFNFWADPEAAAQVFATDFPDVIAVGLDVSHQTLYTAADWNAAEQQTDPLNRMLVEVCRRSFTERAQADFPLHDPLATAVAADLSLVGLESGRIEVILTGEEEGRTVFSRDPSAPWKVATAVDSSRFVREFKEAYRQGT
jgi:inosine-uridine nucleoside N-ribohydrolase